MLTPLINHNNNNNDEHGENRIQVGGSSNSIGANGEEVAEIALLDSVSEPMNESEIRSSSGGEGVSMDVNMHHNHHHHQPWSLHQIP